MEAHGQQIDALESGGLDDPDAIVERLDDLKRVHQVLGPTFYGYADRESFTPIDSTARVLTPSDKTAYEEFRAAILEEEWEQGGLKFSAGNTVGLFVSEELVAIAGYEIWDDVIAHIAVVTHPNHRSEGYGQAVVSRATEHALSAGFLPQYRTLDE
ncbi:GNAT family N-acetyltransferase [Haladaptatus pallidirubidus]|uniref:N-acetyltransferase domain-containing protein n=1 Tax=Haladaptatus pallidirubidus TaxID=1008152 RepID=A0AAV3UQZ8_9EURY|nr:GNAT family N-acetyltransferase [Haladaptatus pallidirubidus]